MNQTCTLLLFEKLSQVCKSREFIIIMTFLCCIILLYTTFVQVFIQRYLNRGRKVQPHMVMELIQENRLIECIQMINKSPNVVNEFNIDGYTPFMIACAYGHTQLVKIMLKNGANVQMKSTKGESPFYLATFFYIKNPLFKNATCIRELYYAGADINEPNDSGLSPLQMAAMFGHTSLVKWLLLKHASTRTIPSPFLIACSQGYLETADLIWGMTQTSNQIEYI